MDSPELINDREAWCERNLKKFSRRQDSTWADALCPIHNEEKPSLTINLETGGFKCLGCNATGVLPELARKASLDMTGLPVIGKSTGKPGRPSREPVAEYIYDDIDGNHVMKVCRYEPKDFRQYRWEGADWKAGLSSNTVRLPYKLPKIAVLKPDSVVLWVEGEKDVDTAWRLGIPATTTPQGAKSLGKIRNIDLEVFRGLVVIGCPDNDQPGRDYIETILERLQPIAKRVGTWTPEGLSSKGDFSDYVATLSGTTDFKKMHILAAIRGNCKKWLPDHKAPTILVGDRDLHDISDQALKSLVGWNQPPKIFHDRSGTMTRLATVEGEPRLVQIQADELRGWLSESGRWRRERKADEVAVYPDLAVAKDICLRRSTQFPLLEHIVRIPVFDSQMRLISEPGYHEDARLFLATGDLKIPDVSPAPSPAEVARARGLYLDDLLCDFPFVDEASLAHVMCAILLPFVRRLTGPTPLHLIESPQVANGKTLLAQILTIPATGRPAAVMSDAGDDEAEWRKSIQSTLQKMPTYILVDNVGSGGIESDTLAAVLTSEEYEGRELGTARNVCYPNRATWIATGNNLHLKLDIARRTMFTRIDSKEARPWERSGFKHVNLTTWALENRPLLVWAALTLCQNWIAQGAPVWTGKTMGSFEQHNRVLGGILETAGVPGFLGNYNEQFRRADTVSEAWEAFVATWWDHPLLGCNPCNTHQLSEMVEEKHLLEGVIKSASVHGRRCSLGRYLQGQIDRIYGNLVIRLHAEKGHNGLRTYRIEKIYPNGEAVRATPAPSAQPELVAAVVQEELF